MNYTIHASYSVAHCRYHLGKKESLVIKLGVPDNLATRLAELATGIIVLGTIGIWLFVA